MTNLMALKGRLLTLNFIATDGDVPAQTLTFSLGDPRRPVPPSIPPMELFPGFPPLSGSNDQFR